LITEAAKQGPAFGVIPVFIPLQPSASSLLVLLQTPFIYVFYFF